MPNFDRIVEEAILKAMQDGEFDNLPGIGKPIIWKENPHSPEDMKLVNDLLQKNDVSFPWIEKRKEIETLIGELKRKIQNNQPISSREREEISEKVALINKKIFDYNLSVPVNRLQRRLLTAEEIFSGNENQ